MATRAVDSDHPVLWSECGRYWFDERAADKAAAFFPRYLRFTKGEWAGRPFVLEKWQEEDIIRPLFGWKRKDGTRRYRRCIVWIPRKNGKTELAGGVSLLALMADAEFGGEVYSIASGGDQAKIVFDIATTMVGASEDLSRHLETFKTSIYCPELGASFKPLTGRPKGKHGLNPSGIIGDEVHEWPDADLYTFVHQGTAGRRQPIEFLISTFGTRGGYGWQLWRECERILSGESEDQVTLVVVYRADEKDDWTDPKTWAKANPNYPTSPKHDYLEEECRKAQSSPRLENDFKRYHLNIWTEQAVRWLPMDAWGPASDEWKKPEFEERLVGRRCFGGVDLSSTTDLTAYCLWFPPEDADGMWIKLTRAFVPEDNIERRVRQDRVPYDEWVRSGALHATPGNVVDYEFVKHAIFEDARRFRIDAIGIDQFLAVQLALQLREEGVNAVLMRQGFLTLSAPSKELERLVLSRRLDHGGHPVARWCAANAAVVSDPAGNIKPAKDKSTERIDVIAADVNALGMAIADEAEEPSVYEDRGILMF
jgi:phage terminase large subunit-like protein